MHELFACRLCSNLGSKIVQTPKKLASMLKNIVSYPPLTHAFLKWPFLTDFKKYTHTPPYGMKFWCSGRKMEKTLKIHEFAPRWHILNVPERYAHHCTELYPPSGVPWRKQTEAMSALRAPCAQAAASVILCLKAGALVWLRKSWTSDSRM